jgi:hypothetical protein
VERTVALTIWRAAVSYKDKLFAEAIVDAWKDAHDVDLWDWSNEPG